MSLHLETVKNLSGYSLAKYATWIYYKPDNILFDAGEGVSIAMRNKIYAVESVFLTHGHGDHIGGLPGFLSSRASSMGDQDKPLALYYPKGDRSIARLRRYIQDSLGSLPFEVSWSELDAGDRVPLSGRRFLEAFPSRHNQNLNTLGYRILEQRTRLKSEYRDFPQEELIAAIKGHGKDWVTEAYEQTILCFSGDSMPLPLEIVRDAGVLVHDCTFLEEADRDDDTHATLDETLSLAIAARVSLLALFHFSTRYSRQQIGQTIRRKMCERRIDFPIYYMLPNLRAFEFKELEAPHE